MNAGNDSPEATLAVTAEFAAQRAQQAIEALVADVKKPPRWSKMELSEIRQAFDARKAMDADARKNNSPKANSPQEVAAKIMDIAATVTLTDDFVYKLFEAEFKKKELSASQQKKPPQRGM